MFVALQRITFVGGRRHFCGALHVAMQIGLYHPLFLERSGVQSLRILESVENDLVRVLPLPAVVHLASDSKDFFDPFTSLVSPCLQQLSELDELREVALLLRR